MLIYLRADPQKVRVSIRREARGEGVYELVREGYIQGGGAWLDDAHIAPVYRFVPTQPVKEAVK